MPIKSLWSSFPQMANPDSKHEPVFAEAAAAHSRRAQGARPGRRVIGSRIQQRSEIPFSAVPARSSEMPLQHMAPFSGTKGSQRPRNAPTVKYGITTATAPHRNGSSYRCQPVSPKELS